MKRKLKDAFKWLLTKLFHLFQRLGFDFLPRHYYSEIPAIYELRKTQHWRQAYAMHGVVGASDTAKQLQFVRDTVTPEISDALQNRNIYEAACQRNGPAGYGAIEAEFLYAFVRNRQPRRIVQAGCGVSTAVCLAAAEDGDYRPEITCIEPYPTGFLQSIERDGLIRLIRKPIELLGYDFLNELRADDLFFVDSTHTLGPAGEVTRIILEMLPRLSDGAYIHFHDIWFPYDYAPDILDEKLFFWHESALLHAFLCMNERFRILASLSMLHYYQSPQFSEIFPSYRPMQTEQGILMRDGDYPSSIYLQVVSSESV